MVNYLVVLQDARSISGQADTWQDAVGEADRLINSWHTQHGKIPAIFFAFSDGTAHRNSTNPSSLSEFGSIRTFAQGRDEAILREQHARFSGLFSPTGHPVCSRCDHGPAGNCRCSCHRASVSA